MTTYLSKVKGIQKLYLYLVRRTFQLSDNKAHCFQLSAWPLVMIWAIKVIVKWFQIANCIQLLREGQSMKLISVLSWNGNCNFIYTVHRLSSSDSKTHCIIWAIKVPIKWLQIVNCTQLLRAGHSMKVMTHIYSKLKRKLLPYLQCQSFKLKWQ